MGKLLFTLKNAFLHRKQIKTLLSQNKHQITTITALSTAALKKHNIKYLAIDFDGVLAAHGQKLPHNEIKEWLTTFSQAFNEENIFIVSNKPTPARLEYFNKHFPSIRCITGVRKKPYPDGLLSIQQQVNCKPSVLALVDDRVLTGCLASMLAGSFPILVTSPYKNYRSHPFQESFFGFLRFTERVFFL